MGQVTMASISPFRVMSTALMIYSTIALPPSTVGFPGRIDPPFNLETAIRSILPGVDLTSEKFEMIFKGSFWRYLKLAEERISGSPKTTGRHRP